MESMLKVGEPTSKLHNVAHRYLCPIIMAIKNLSTYGLVFPPQFSYTKVLPHLLKITAGVRECKVVRKGFLQAGTSTTQLTRTNVILYS